MKKSTGTVALILSIVAVLLGGAALFVALRPAQQPAQPAVPAMPAQPTQPVEAEAADVQYVLYLGTNDKDTNEAVFSPEEAQEKVKEVLVRHFGGYTLQDASGGWVDDKGTLYQEYTLVIYLSDTDLEHVHAASDELIKVFNQSSVLIQSNRTLTEFYSGSGN